MALGSGEAARLISAARFHRVAPLVLSAYRSSGQHSFAQLEEDRRQAIMNHLQVCHALAQLGSVLSDVGWVTFKGPVFSEFAHPVPGLRTYNDLDVLVAPESLREVCGRLVAAKWQVADFRDMLRNSETPGEMHWVSPGGVLVDLHWSMINMHSRRRRFDVPTSSLLERRVAVTLAGTPAWTLDPCDSLVHACLHASLAGANKLLYLLDVDGLSRQIADWDELATRARQWRAQAQVALVLGRARRVLGTRMPTDVDTRLEVPATIRGLLALTDRVAPVPDARQNVGTAKFVARAVRSSTSGTIRAVGANATRGVRERFARGTRDPVDRMRADEASLDVYLDAVEAAAGHPV